MREEKSGLSTILYIYIAIVGAAVVFSIVAGTVFVIIHYILSAFAWVFGITL